MSSQLRNCHMSQEETLNSVANGYDYSPDTSECVVKWPASEGRNIMAWI